MIKSFYTIGSHLIGQEEYAHYFNPWANPFPKNLGDAIVVIAEINDGVFSGLTLETFSKQKVDKYLFREAKANATNLVPTFYLQAQADKDKQTESIRKVIKKAKASIVNYKHKFISSDQFDEIEKELLNQELNTGTSYLFTLKLDGKYFGDFTEYKNLFLTDAYQKYSKDSSSKNKLCSVTYQEVEEVWGRVDTLGFTVNDISFCRNGFNGRDSYKMFPVSPDAVKILEGTKRLVVEKLAKNFFGLKYFVLPHFIIEDDEVIENVLLSFLNAAESSQVSLENQGRSIINNETLINEIVENEALSKNAIYYDIFFFQPNNAQFLIKIQLSDILPSRFKKILDTKTKIEDRYKLLTTINIPANKGKESQEINFQITFSTIKDYFSKKGKIDYTFHPYFFKILEAVFYGTTKNETGKYSGTFLNEEQILTAFLNEIKIGFKNIENQPFRFSQLVKETFAIYHFFFQLNLFKGKPYKSMTDNTTTVGLTLEEFELQHSEFFNTPLKKAAFYVGCQVEKLLEIQRRSLNNHEPFRKNLNGLNIDKDQLKKIHINLKKKLNDYQLADKIYHSEREYIEKLEVYSFSIIMDSKDNLSKTDISYAFATGMVMQKEFSKEKRRLAQMNKN